MWFLGFSTNRKNLWIIGAIILVILLTVILRKFAVYLDAQARKISSERDVERGSTQKQKMCSVCSSVAVIRTYALEELKMATRDFRIQIGVGATSFVYLAELGDGRFGAVKRVMEERGGTRKIFLDEVSVLLRISHPNLVGLLGFCLEKGEQLLLLEFVPNKSLFDRMHTHYGQSMGILSWSNRLNIALDIARALNYLHSQADPPIIHRDIKSSNVLLIDNDHAKLADFGICKLGQDHDRSNNGSQTPLSIKGSFGYIDTSYLKTGLVSPKSDVYSFGVLILELVTGLKSTQGSDTLADWTRDWRENNDIEIWVQMLDPKLNGNAKLEQLKVFVDIANCALVENSEKRPDMSSIVDRILNCMEPQSHIDELTVHTTCK
ncbi:hypothetical protein Ddye_015276 [Dipteronia dyeriana]|uniref:non-specific serine/threonine protein kinase n=1 Tax=Dipteronia dyeriana TaxID=168575 RepID=A0AAD9U4Y7_9ROSI|nr:hypothetical protein Ddye_015276 [Dipteronia dyeriana]